ncbi:kelch repeat-containing protein At3g27220 isoform X2 [Cryptomeria japonica]|uniref:kelch repeat-containing protein At3g27220 isoform X2 n=1 Tax=Cryptomeria japonica TaxID=3369 RepID=UPI0025AD5956|nr:kelch repeat-containing protein At3g27220 isoform X2 [Cryptomeria japonica]
MAKPFAKQSLLRYTIVAICAGIVVLVLFTNVLWASSYANPLSKRSVHESERKVLTINKLENVKEERDTQKEKAKNFPNEDNALELEWEEMAEAPVPRLDGAGIQIGNLFYVFAGYGTIDLVHSHVDVYNFTDNTWGGRFDMPKDMAHSHLGMVTDGRYIYIVTGQYGPQCRGPTALNFVLDTKTKKWSSLPALPVPRYAPATQLWRGRLHVMGGSKEDRHEPALEHWSIAVKDGKAVESEWKSEIQIPRGGPHRACIVVDDRLLVIGGQEGDFMAKPGSPIFKCSRRSEVVYSDVYMLDGEGIWKQLPSMPKPDSHIEFAWVVVNNSIVIVGGTTEKHPVTKRMVLIGDIFQFDLNVLEWRIIGKTPYRLKTTLVGLWEGWLYFTSGQRDKGVHDSSPKKVLGKTWRTKLHLPVQ